jgi:hypothetical protein
VIDAITGLLVRTAGVLLAVWAVLFSGAMLIDLAQGYLEPWRAFVAIGGAAAVFWTVCMALMLPLKPS